MKTGICHIGAIGGGVSWNAVWIALFVAGFGFFFIGMPKYYDDYMYMVHLRPWFASQGIDFPENGGDVFRAGIPWRGICETWFEHYGNDNIRLPNLLIPFFLLFPKWFGSGIMTLLWGWTVVTLLRLTAHGWRYSPLVPVSLALLTFCMPWRDYFGAMDYQFNYIFSAWMASRLLLWTGCGTTAPKTGRVSMWRSAAAGICLGFAVGICHEGISVPVAAGLAAVALCFRSRRQAGTFAAVVGLAAGASLLLSVPGMRYRSSDLVEAQNLIWVFRHLQMDGTALWLYLILAAMTLVRRSKRRQLVSPRQVFISVSTAVSLAILCYCGLAVRRACFWLDFVCIAGAVDLLRINLGRRSRRYGVAGTVVAVPLLAAVYVHLAAVGAAALKLRKLHAEVISAYVGNPESNMFGDIETLREQSLLTGYMPDFRFYATGMFNVRWYYGFGEPYWNCCEVIFPSVFRYIDSTSGTPASADGKIRKAGNLYFARSEDLPIDTSEDMNVSLWMDFGKGYVHVLSGAYPFRSEKDGREYVWIIPGTDWYVTHFKKVRGMRVSQSP